MRWLTSVWMRILIWAVLIAFVGSPWGDILNDTFREFAGLTLLIGVPFFSFCYWITQPFDRRY